eukprot:scaffold310320_cov41-Prasinocladus_malaysianus.AAC.1
MAHLAVTMQHVPSRCAQGGRAEAEVSWVAVLLVQTSPEPEFETETDRLEDDWVPPVRPFTLTPSKRNTPDIT